MERMVLVVHGPGVGAPLGLPVQEDPCKSVVRPGDLGFCQLFPEGGQDVAGLGREFGGAAVAETVDRAVLGGAAGLHVRSTRSVRSATHQDWP